MRGQSKELGILWNCRSVGYRWWWLMLGIALVAGALFAGRLLLVSADDTRARVAQTVQALLDGGQADPFSQPQAEPLDPAAQSVQSYLRAHQVKPSLWEQMLAVIRQYLRGH